MTGKTSKKRSKWFRVAVEGATSDGRAIERTHIQQMADSYDRQVYGARIWMEHLRSKLPDSPFCAYGDVLAVKAEEVDIAGERKLALFAQIEPTAHLVTLVNVLKQKVFTSIEIAPNFADSGKAYLQGLAVTDSPASLGTEMLAFAAQHPDANPLACRKQAPGNVFTAATETSIEFEDVTAPASRSSRLGALFTALLGTPEPHSAAEPDPLETPQLRAFSVLMQQAFAEQEDQIAQLQYTLSTSQQQLGTFRTEFDALKAQLDSTAQPFTQRPPVTGPASGQVTDC